MRPDPRAGGRGRRAVRRLLGALALACACGAAVPTELAAQGAPADTAAVLLEVARQLEVEDRTELAAALFALIAERYPGTPAAQEAGLRLSILGTGRADASGRVELMVWSTLYGLWLGVAMPAMLGADEAAPYGLGLLLGGPAGFLTARSYAAGRLLGEGHARTITFGGTWGTWQGFGWREVFDLGDPDRPDCAPEIAPDPCFESDANSTRAIFAAAVLGGLAGIGAGAALARSHDISAGTATAVNLGALWGTWFGTAGGVVADLEGDALLGAALLGGDAALLGMALAAPAWDVSRGRARLVSIIGVAGALGGFGLDLLFEVDDTRTAMLLPMVTSAAALGLGIAWTADDDAGRSGAGKPSPGALLDLRDGRANWDVPMPVPTVLLRRTPSGRSWEPGLRLSLIQARF